MDALIKFLYQLEPVFVIVGEAVGIAGFLLSRQFKLREQSPSSPKWIELIKPIANQILVCAAFLVIFFGCLSAYTKISFTLTPDVLGDSISEAKQKLADYGLGIESKEGQNTSDDVITGQSPDAGTPIHKGLNVEVTFTSPPLSSEPPSSEPPSSEPPSSEPPSSEPPSSEPPSSEPPSSEPPSSEPPSSEPPSSEPPSSEPPSSEPPSSEPPIQSVSLSQSSLSLFVGDSVSLTASGGNGSYSWSSSNSSVVTVSNGSVSAVGRGSATISVSSDGKTASCPVTVQDYSLSLSETYISMFAGESKTISASGAPSGVTVSWSSNNSRVATVSNGRISAVASGSATITAQFTSGGRNYSATCQVNVSETGITLSQYSISDLYVGGTANLTASTSPGGQSVSWSSSNSSVATVSNGRVTAVGVGSATITAQFVYGGTTYSESCSVSVIEVSVRLSNSSLSMSVGDSEYLSVTTSPRGTNISWSSSNSSVASVNSNGKVTAVGAGSAMITAQINCGGQSASATCSVNVTAPSIQLSSSSLSMTMGGTESLSAYTTPSGQSVNWSSSNSSVATVSNGRVTAVGAGSATITAQFVYGETTYSESCSVSVIEVSVRLSNSSLSMSVGDSEYLSATTSPRGTSISWSSTNSSVASVNSSGKVTAVGAGSAMITAQINYGDQFATATCSVNVTAPSIQLSSSSLSMTVGDTESLSAYTTPSGRSVNWSSSNTSVATVSSSGRLSAVGAGSTTITAKISVGGNNYSATCAVVVKSNVVAPTNYAISASESSVNTGDTFRITVSPNVECTSIVIWCVAPTGETYNYDITSCRTSNGYYKDVYTYDTGEWKFYAVVSNEAGTYSGSTSKSYCTVTVCGATPPSGYDLYALAIDFHRSDFTMQGVGSICQINVSVDYAERQNTTVKLFCVKPDGSTISATSSNKGTGVWDYTFDQVGTYIFYAEVSNEFGTYKGSTTKSCLRVTITED